MNLIGIEYIRCKLNTSQNVHIQTKSFKLKKEKKEIIIKEKKNNKASGMDTDSGKFDERRTVFCSKALQMKFLRR